MTTTSQLPSTIECGVPIPPAGGRGISETLRQLARAEVGASVLFPDARRETIDKLARRIVGRRAYAVRKVDGGIRIWKIAEPSVTA